MRTNEQLIELLTWAVVELEKPGEIERAKLAKVIDLALQEALKSQERETNAKAALLRTSHAMGF